MNDLNLILPEILLTTFVCLLLIVDVFRKPAATGVTFWTAVVSVGVVLLVVISGWPTEKLFGFSRTLVIDPMSVLLKAVLLLSLLFNFFYARDFYDRNQSMRTEFFILAIRLLIM